MRRTFFAAIMMLLTTGIFAQRGWEAGGWVGAANYFGDLNTNLRFTDVGIAGGAIFRYNFNTRLALKFSGNYGRVGAFDFKSDNPYERARNLDFRSDVLDGSFQMEFNFLNYVHGSRDEFFTPYLFGGLSVINFNPTTEYQGEIVELRPLGTEGQFQGEEYFTTTGGLLYGAGFKISLTYRWSINIEAKVTHMFTDYLDDVSTVYPDPDNLENFRNETAIALSNRSIPLEGLDESLIAQPGRQRGNSQNNDSYTMVGVGVLYYFGQLRCPEYGSRKKRKN